MPNKTLSPSLFSQCSHTCFLDYYVKCWISSYYSKVLLTKAWAVEVTSSCVTERVCFYLHLSARWASSTARHSGRPFWLNGSQWQGSLTTLNKLHCVKVGFILQHQPVISKVISTFAFSRKTLKAIQWRQGHWLYAFSNDTPPPKRILQSY